MDNLSISLSAHSGIITFIDLAEALSYLNVNTQNMETTLYVMGNEKEIFDPFSIFSFQFIPKQSVHFKDWLKLATDIAASTPETQVHILPATSRLSEMCSAILAEGYRSQMKLSYFVNEKGFADVINQVNPSAFRQINSSLKT